MMSAISESGSCRVLSIQSHVVSGSVGNKSAVFPLQLLGFDVDFINSVQFSNHTGYPNKWKGTVLSGQELTALCTGLQDNHLFHYDYLLTGYIGSETFLTSIISTLDAIKAVNPNAKYVCDPVLGDHDQYYVPAELVQIFRQQLIPRAYMITPNQFEAELLTESKIHSEDDAVSALISLRKLGPEVVVLTSAELQTLPEDANTMNINSDCSEENESLFCYVLYPIPSSASDRTSSASDRTSSASTSAAAGAGATACITRIEIEKLEGHFTGTGDATAALMLAWVHLLQQQQQQQQLGDSGKTELNAYSAALRNSLSTVKAMIQRSSVCVRGRSVSAAPASNNINNNSCEDSADKCALIRARELQVVQSKRDIECPPTSLLAARSIKTWAVSY